MSFITRIRGNKAKRAQRKRIAAIAQLENLMLRFQQTRLKKQREAQHTDESLHLNLLAAEGNCKP